MAKEMYFGDNSDIARKITKAYVGVNGVARKIKAGYYGENGVARQFYGGSGDSQLVHYKMLFDNGDECTDITGGWDGYISSTVSYYSGTKSKLTAGTDEMHNASSINFRQWSSRVTNNTINYTDYTYIGACFKSVSFGRHSQFRFNINSSATQDKETQTNVVGFYVPTQNQGGTYTSKTIMTQAITTYSSGCYVTMNVVGTGSPSGGYGYIYTVFFLQDDDWQSLASEAGITASSISDILTQSSTLLSNESAVNFMIKNCTGNFMVDALNSSTFMSALNSSQYKSTIYANEHWNKFLTMRD
jgi:hypothetical protein